MTSDPLPPDDAALASAPDFRPSRELRLIDRYRHLQDLLLVTILSLLVMSLGVNLFLFKQMQGARTQLAASRAMTRTLSEQYQVKEPAMRQFVQSLQTFSATHPEFQPVLQRYRSGLAQFFTDLPIARPGTLGTAPTAPASPSAPSRQ